MKSNVTKRWRFLLNPNLWMIPLSLSLSRSLSFSLSLPLSPPSPPPNYKDPCYVIVRFFFFLFLPYLGKILINWKEKQKKGEKEKTRRLTKRSRVPFCVSCWEKWLFGLSIDAILPLRALELLWKPNKKKKGKKRKEKKEKKGWKKREEKGDKSVEG